MENEEPFAVEAADEALLSRIRSLQAEGDSKSYSQTDTPENESSADESSPLIRTASGVTRRRLSRDMRSYDRSIQQPGTRAQDLPSLPWYKRASLPWLLIPFLPFCIAFGGILVPKTYLISELVCQQHLSDRAAKDPAFHFMPVIIGSENPQCQSAEISALVARFQLYMNLCTSILSAITTAHYGALSDRIGRTKVIVISSIGALLSEIVTIWVGTHPLTVSVNWLLLGSLLDGLGGSFTTSMAAAFAYASDTSPPERRNVAFGYFHGTLFAGVALGPMLASLIIKKTGSVMAYFYLATGCHTFFVVFILLFVPESLSKVRQLLAREKFRLKRDITRDDSWLTKIKNYNPLEPLWVLRPSGPGSSSKLRRNLVLLAAIDATMFGAAMGTMGIIILYAKYKFDFDAVDSSNFVSYVNICRVTALVVALPLLTRWARGGVKNQSLDGRGSDMLDINIIRGAIVFDMLGYIGYALLPTGNLFVAAGMIASLGGMGSPSLQSSLTKSVPADRTGQMLGASGLLHAIARVVAPTIFGVIYSFTVAKFAGAVFLCIGSLFLLASIMSWFLKPHLYFDESLAEDTGEHVEQ